MTSLPTSPNVCSPQFSTTQRVLDEGAQPLLTAARIAGLNGEGLPSLKTLLRAAISRKLDAVKVAGRWLTSAEAIRRWIEAAQHRRERFAVDGSSADRVLDAFGLGRTGPK